ncbi:MAG: DUF4340 domain-containing protein [Oscillospiraceae bacterium]|nr:DUF4340 domain-containing protein [Oscillospiraceae bacterium]
MRKYMILLLVLAVALLCLFGCSRKVEQPSDTADTDTASTENTIVDSAVVEAQSKFLQYCDGEITVRLNHDETGWHWVDEPTFPLDGDKVEELVAALHELSALQPLQANEDLSLYGLDEPQKYLTMTVEEGSLHLNIGDQAEDGSWYMSVENYDGIYACPDSFVQMLGVSIYDMAVLPTLPAFTSENVSRILVTGSEGQVFLRNVDGQWKGSGEHVTDRIDKIFAGLGSLQMGRCFDYLPSQQALNLCGFSTPTATITVEYLNSVNVESSFTLTLGALHSVEEGYYATISGDETLYLLPAAQVSPLLVLLIYAN